MITDEKIELNKERFLSLIESLDRSGIDKEALIEQLLDSDFFTAPASTTYHSSFKGGLCEHCLLVYDALVNLMKVTYNNECPYSDDTIKIVALFHDFDKMNKYEVTARNTKVYSDTGSKKDELGRFDWVSVMGYKRKDSKDVFTVGTHGETSVFMTETFIPLTTEEHCAIVNHHSVYDNPKLDSATVYRKFPLACLLHLADMISALVLEKYE